MFNTMAEVKAANKTIGHYFFSPDTMRFFASRIESELYIDKQMFITSEKSGFDDNSPRLYKVRRVKPDGSIQNEVTEPFKFIEDARDFIKGYGNE